MTYRKSKRQSLRTFLKRVLHPFLLSLLLIVITSAIGPGYYTPAEWTARMLGQTLHGMGFDLLEWERTSISAKAQAFMEQPADAYSAEEGAQLVKAYLDRAQRVAAVEDEIEALMAQASIADGAVVGEWEASPDGADLSTLQEELDGLREEQAESRAAVEQLIQRQVGSQLVAAGFTMAGRPMPPVLFGFVEPPKKMVVSPRNEIVTVYSYMLDAELSLATIEGLEQEIYDEHDLSVFITNIGGLGAYPTMVVEQAGLEWILSTVAHEWAHNYLSFFPLGLRYTVSADLTTMNETVAEIVGYEIGGQTLLRYYPELALPPISVEESAEESVSTEDVVIGEEVLDDEMLTESTETVFDFHEEMRQTRLRVDELLADEEVEEAETYMEARRQLFAENGYPLRVLNQAYFAFHGSYGTSPASSSSIGPDMTYLRALTPDLETFLRTVRSFTSEEDLQRALEEWSPHESSTEEAIADN